MATTTYSSYAVIGAGGVGHALADELLNLNAKVTVLTRDESKAELQALKNRGATLVQVDYDDTEAVAKALVGIEAV